MREYIDRFRQLAEYLLANEILTTDDILKVMGISPPTLTKLLKEPIHIVKIRASVLAKVQDFLKLYAAYQGLVIGSKGKDRGKVTNGDLDLVVAEAKDMLDTAPPVVMGGNIWSLMRKIETMLPSNMSIHIVINSKKA